MNEIIILSFILCLFYIIFETNALPHYLGLFNKRVFLINEYNEFQKNSPIRLNYLEFLNSSKKNNRFIGFFSELLSCPNCLFVWVAITINLLCNLGWQNIGYEIICLWIGYALLTFILKKLYE